LALIYLRDLFGTYHVSAIHGRLLTAWSVAGVLGPVLVNYMREYQLEHGADRASAYQTVLHVMAGLCARVCGESTGSPGGAEILAEGRRKNDAGV
jgi:hypothetical protein